jgi:hypothetical protein
MAISKADSYLAEREKKEEVKARKKSYFFGIP